MHIETVRQPLHINAVVPSLGVQAKGGIVNGTMTGDDQTFVSYVMEQIHEKTHNVWDNNNPFHRYGLQTNVSEPPVSPSSTFVSGIEMNEELYASTLQQMHALDKHVVQRDGSKSIPSYFRNDFRAQREKNSSYGTRRSNRIQDLDITRHLNARGIELIEEDSMARQYAKQRATKIFRQKRNIVKSGSVILPLVARSFIPKTYALRTNDRVPELDALNVISSSEQDSESELNTDDDEEEAGNKRRQGRRHRRRPSKFHVSSEEEEEEEEEEEADLEQRSQRRVPQKKVKKKVRHAVKKTAKKRKRALVISKFLVERILSRRGQGENLEFLVKWYGFGNEMCTWERASSFTSATISRLVPG